MNKTVAKEKLEYYKGFKNNLWTLFIVLSGGNIGLSLNLNTLLKKIFVISGFIFDIAVITGIIVCIVKIRRYIYQLGE